VEATIIEHAAMTTGEYIPAKKGPVLKGMGYIGTRPTVKGLNRSIEVNFFDLHEDLYGKTVQIQFLHFVRHDHKFDSVEALTSQLAADEKQIRTLLGA